MSSDESVDNVLACLEDSGSEFQPDTDESYSNSDILTDDDNTPIEKKKKQNTAKKDDQKKKKKKDTINGTAGPSNNSPSSNRRQISPRRKVVRAVVQAFKKKEERPFTNLMTGVVFGISGYENPLRSELRNKALAMGARYEANWNCNCTHLICAFRNTPKYHQVRGSGKIVKKEWIEESYSRRIRFPWRRFALDPNDASQAESEEEIYEEVKRPNPSKRSADEEFSEDSGDTDDEIEKVRQKQKKLNGNSITSPSTSGIKNNFAGSSGSDKNAETESSSSVVDKKHVTKEKTSDGTENIGTDSDGSINKQEMKVNGSTHKEETSIYDMDTESEDENYWVKCKPEENSLPPLPAFFQDATIALLDDLSDADRKLLTRYIKAHKGAIADDRTDLNTILYAVTEDSSAIERVRQDYPQVIGVTPEWIWRSHDEAKLLPASLFKVLQ